MWCGLLRQVLRVFNLTKLADLIHARMAHQAASELAAHLAEIAAPALRHRLSTPEQMDIAASGEGQAMKAAPGHQNVKGDGAGSKNAATADQPSAKLQINQGAAAASRKLHAGAGPNQLQLKALATTTKLAMSTDSGLPQSAGGTSSSAKLVAPDADEYTDKEEDEFQEGWAQPRNSGAPFKFDMTSIWARASGRAAVRDTPLCRLFAGAPDAKR